MVNALVKKYLQTRLKTLYQSIQTPHKSQLKTLKGIVSKNKLDPRCSHPDHLKKLPLSNYETIADSIHSMMLGQANKLTKEPISWFSKSSGTTNGRSKYIPVTKSFLFNNHIRASWYAAALIYDNNPKATIFKYKNLLMGGSITPFEPNPSVLTGDISGFTISNIPAVGRPFYSPDFKTALINDWDEKIDKMVNICSKDRVFLFAGVPTWTLVLFKKMLDHTGKNNILEIWPDAAAYMHGGVNFEPYKNQFKKLLPRPDFHYMEIYNASEGAFAVQNNANEEGMLLLLDIEIYYEFIPQSQIIDQHSSTLSLSEVETNKNYIMVISTASGLTRYVIGDVIKFTSTNPYKIKVVGRTKEYINAFGEEIMIENAEQALANVCNELDLEIENYSVAPVYLSTKEKGKHQWLVEFKDEFNDKANFERKLDLELQKINSDYEAKRQHSLAIEQLELVNLPKGTFEKWMRSKGRFGNQSKVPRLKNDRSIADEILSLI